MSPLDTPVIALGTGLWVLSVSLLLMECVSPYHCVRGRHELVFRIPIVQTSSDDSWWAQGASASGARGRGVLTINLNYLDRFERCYAVREQWLWIFLKMRAGPISLPFPPASTYTQERLCYLLLLLISVMGTLAKPKSPDEGMGQEHKNSLASDALLNRNPVFGWRILECQLAWLHNPE